MKSFCRAHRAVGAPSLYRAFEVCYPHHQKGPPQSLSPGKPASIVAVKKAPLPDEIEKYEHRSNLPLISCRAQRVSEKHTQRNSDHHRTKARLWTSLDNERVAVQSFLYAAWVWP